MSEHRIGRRAFIKGAGAGLAGLGAAGIIPGEFLEAAQQATPNSAGTELPKLKAPPHACDCHQHIYDAARFPPLPQGFDKNEAPIEFWFRLKR